MIYCTVQFCRIRSFIADTIHFNSTKDLNYLRIFSFFPLIYIVCIFPDCILRIISYVYKINGNPREFPILIGIANVFYISEGFINSICFIRTPIVKEILFKKKNFENEDMSSLVLNEKLLFRTNNEDEEQENRFTLNT